jgi:hypothetical protein
VGLGATAGSTRTALTFTVLLAFVPASASLATTTTDTAPTPPASGLPIGDTVVADANICRPTRHRPRDPTNDHTRVSSFTDHRYIAFVDCQTPIDADYLPHEQEHVARTLLTEEAQARTSVPGS